ncbi:hypothetical protein CANCADRAFT_140289 [Tortispora caseinolytica NRRL Y-17796]|uniref:cystathionine gamma-synthase n=1 Tax=Tortispora caseinolytica NRRL Y-17796 TaxID=767744 RepID=A0A1E4TCN6_9ASCO|nr:hypothetical protein CANCADRAFT_140289 [Tortispora caseinolytica NRRL Y-17796]
MQLGKPIPPSERHAVSVSLPTWESNIGYEEGVDWVVNSMETGYPRFRLHDDVVRLNDLLIRKYGKPNEKCLVFRSYNIGCQCRDFIAKRAPDATMRTIQLSVPSIEGADPENICIVLFDQELFPLAKQYWQHSGNIISSRFAEFCYRMMSEKYRQASAAPIRPPHRQYAREKPTGTIDQFESDEMGEFMQERFGRTLSINQAGLAKMALRRRIAGTADDDKANASEEESIQTHAKPSTRKDDMSENDVFLYPSGMSSIYNAHQLLMKICKQPLKSVCFGFAYADTPKVLEKFGPGMLFYGNGEDEDLDNLQLRLASGERFLALFCEFPSNPLLKCGNLKRIRELADTYKFPVVVDETIGNYVNVNVLQYADIVCSSLTKLFSGDSNVMAGCLIINNTGRMYKELLKMQNSIYEDTFWLEDAIILERNSRSFATRAQIIDKNALKLCTFLKENNHVQTVYYPYFNPTRKYYDLCRTANGGYGGLFSVLFDTEENAKKFFDALDTYKGPSLGTNFTLTCPYVILAHYGELEWAAQFGIQRHLIRVSVGLEDSEELISKFKAALQSLDS